MVATLQALVRQAPVRRWVPVRLSRTPGKLGRVALIRVAGGVTEANLVRPRTWA